MTGVPPAVGPCCGVIEETVGGGTYVKPPGSVPVWPSGFRTTTSAEPADPAGVTHVICDDETTVTLVAAVPPIVTVAFN